MQYFLHMENQSTSPQSIGNNLKDSLPNLHNLGAPFKDLAGGRTSQKWKVLS